MIVFTRLLSLQLFLAFALANARNDPPPSSERPWSPATSRAFVTLMLAVSCRELRRLHATGDPSKRTRPPSRIFLPFFCPSLTTDLYSDCPGQLSATFGKIRN